MAALRYQQRTVTIRVTTVHLAPTDAHPAFGGTQPQRAKRVRHRWRQRRRVPVPVVAVLTLVLTCLLR